MKLNINPDMTTRKIAEQIYRFKYYQILLQVLADNIDSCLVEIEQPTRVLYINAYQETKMLLKRVTANIADIRKAVKVICSDMYKDDPEQEQNRIDIAEGINELLSIYRLDTDTSDDNFKRILNKFTHAFATARREQNDQNSVIDEIEKRVKQEFCNHGKKTEKGGVDMACKGKGGGKKK